MLAFEQGSKQEMEYTKIKGKPYIQPDAPHVCAARLFEMPRTPEGYKVGQVRGGVSISRCPWTSYLAAARQAKHAISIAAFMEFSGYWAWVGLTYASDYAAQDH